MRAKGDKLVKKVTEVSWHRNGIDGKGFYAILFTSDLDDVSAEEEALWNIQAGKGMKDAKFYAALTDEPGECYVVCLDYIPTRGVRFGGNSWRGDQYETELRAAVKRMSSSGSVRVGPFALPAFD